MNKAGPWSSKAFADELGEGNSSSNSSMADSEMTSDAKGVDVFVPKQRRRSLSVSTVQPSVETVVVKAKRAASSLWMLLHAQSCVLAGKCPHAGCQGAKLMHLHLKTCPSVGNGVATCPTNYHGCDQARKLLEHYRRCKSLRSRCQVGCRREISQQQQHCLICSFVARQARTVLVGGGKGGSSFSASNIAPILRKQLPKYSVSFVVSVQDNSLVDDDVINKPSAAPSSAALSSPLTMPPPPSRQFMVGSINSNSSSSESSSSFPPLRVLPVPTKAPFLTSEPTITPEQEPSLLSEPDAASILCSLVGLSDDCNQRQPSVPGLVLRRRDRSASNAAIFSSSSASSSSSLPYHHHHRPRSASVGCSPNSIKINNNHDHYPPTREVLVMNHQSFETIHEEERSHQNSQQSRDLAAELGSARMS